jgi:hypothetical protein
MTRLVSGVALAATALVAIRFLPLLPLRVLACLVAALAAKEYLEIVDSPIRAVVLVIALCWVVSGTTIVSPLILLTMALLWVAAEVLISNHSIQQASTGIFGAIYIGMPLGMLVAVHGLLGWRATLLLLGTVVVSDSMQYYTGRLLGRHPLAPAISPKKTIEGAIGGVIFGTRISDHRRGAGAAILRLCTADHSRRARRRPGHLRGFVRVAVETHCWHEGQFSADTRPRRCARSHRRTPLCRRTVLSLHSKRHVKRLAILGSTGSIGRSALAVVDAHPERLKVVALAAGDNAPLLAEQVHRYAPDIAAMATSEGVDRLRAACGANVRVTMTGGAEGLVAVATHPPSIS